MNEQPYEWPFVRVGLIVTGETEQQCLPDLFRILTSNATCNFRVIGRVGQRSPRSPKNVARMVGSGKKIPDRDADKIGKPAREFLRLGGDFVILVDDLEASRASQAQAVFERYRRALDVMLGAEAARAAVHFLVNMLEAYYFADAKAINGVLGTSLQDFDGDVETITNPKADLKKVYPAFREKEHGPRIVRQLDIAHVLSRPDACASLRTMFIWAVKATRSPTEVPPGAEYEPTMSQVEGLSVLMEESFREGE